ncbi:hypothetical protein JRQ81_001734 [Phrynocephalus forsythii]|uniref:HTH CENPB-type domain-containing protein n=1 Tax=Phrynocephalus forsythii TaxID=171643 RepID=A0A9Q0Y7R3_9SAUR|nr:hypothetical protein JRQ81_001734 [Phrynocephalus forsythii]
MEKVEKLLLIWVGEKQHARDTVSEAMIWAKAKILHTDLLDQQPETPGPPEEFKVSRVWFEKFKVRSGIHSVVRHGEAANSDLPPAEDFTAEFLHTMSAQGYLPQQVFNCDDTGLFWKRMAKRTYITEEETRLPSHKPMKDCLTLLFCANTTGNLKVTPLLVYQSENPWAFKKHKVDKDLFWRSKSNVWVTCILFVHWVNFVFGPDIKWYVLDKNLPLKALLVMDNVLAHPPGLKEDLLEELIFIKVMFLLPNTTCQLQPMDQQVISNFKNLYTRGLFHMCLEMIDGTSLTLCKF